MSTLGRCEFNIRMHVLVSCQSLGLVGETLDLALGDTCLELKLTLKYHLPLHDFG
jgi:hypothetical protein